MVDDKFGMPSDKNVPDVHKLADAVSFARFFFKLIYRDEA
jgi:hypothetical protein